jgi:hypothetical protein
MGGDAVGKKSSASYEVWKRDYATFFPPPNEAEEGSYEINGSLYPEATIDSLRERKK